MIDKKMKTTEIDTDRFLKGIQKIFKHFDSKNLPQKPLSKENWGELLKSGVCLPAIPKQYGGRESHKETCEIIEMLSEYNLPLGMYTMIVTVLFLRNVSLSGTQQVQDEVFGDFLQNPVIGGLAFTEPTCGSNLARMETTYIEENEGYRLRGMKHWQAFSAHADWWIICAKNPNKKEFSYFVHKKSDGGFVTKEIYESLGLKNLGYGLNDINVFVPSYRRLCKYRDNLGDAAEILCASRFSKAAMSSGFLRRLLIEAKSHAKGRNIGKGTLYDIDYVKYKISTIKGNYIICNSLYHHLLLNEDYRDDINKSMFASLATKVLSTELMLESAIDYQQLCGGDGYRIGAKNNIAAYALLDSRVYTLFDGNNDLLCQHLASIVKHEMIENGFKSFYEFSKNDTYMKQFLTYLPTLEGSIGDNIEGYSQAEMVVFGRILSRIYGISRLVERAGRLADMPGAGLVNRPSQNNTSYNEQDIEFSVKLLIFNIKSLTDQFCMINTSTSWPIPRYY
tara:strand:+ start:903 stop:2423 length:1521 start_codon:yes stop_codon:yes gene_type:complete